MLPPKVSRSTIAAGVDSEFAVAGAQVLHERVAGDHDLRRPSGLQSPHRLEPILESAVIRFYRIVGVLLDVVPRRREQPSSTPGRPARHR
jgi:hypothetical protein